MTFRKIGKIRKFWDNFNKSISDEFDTKDSKKSKGSNGIIEPKIISYYSDFEERKYYEGFAKALTERCKGFGLDYDISEIKSRGDYGSNCLMKPEFILDKIKFYRRPLIWMDCDTDLKEPFPHFNNIAEDIGMATHRVVT